jgi:endogenous inhibitor of DNA gyrase (YacG/DUF329 family)
VIRGRCPICGKSFEVGSLGDLPSFPFCSDRCRLIDLGRWVDGSYAIPARPDPSDSSPSPAEPSEEEPEDV